MKIRTIMAVLLVLALVLSSTGVAFAYQDEDGDGEPDRDCWVDGYPPNWIDGKTPSGNIPGGFPADDVQ